MFDKCFGQIESTIGGKSLSDGEKNRLQAAFTEAFLKEAQDGNLSAQATLAKAAERYRTEALHDAEVAAHRKFLQAQYMTNLASEMVTGKGAKFKTRGEFVQRLLGNHYDMRSGLQSVEALQRGIFQNASRELRPILEFIGSKSLGMVEASENAALFVRELYGEATGNAQAKAAAAAWIKMTDAMRERFNRGGGDIGKLENWLMPQGWSTRALVNAWKFHPEAATAPASARAAMAREVWVNDQMRVADRAKYIDYETGIPMDDAQLRHHLDETAKTIITETQGADPAKTVGTSGSIANRGAAHRQIHIKDADGWLEMSQKYGASPVQSSLITHIKSTSSNIALVEKLGPNSKRTIDFLLAIGEQEARDTGSAAVKSKESAESWIAKEMWRYIAQQDMAIQPRGLANVLAGWRNLNVMKLAGALISNLADLVAMHNQAAWTGQSNAALFMQQLSQYSPKNAQQKHLMENAGLMAEMMNDRIYRHMRDVIDSGWTGAVSDVVMRASLLPKFNDLNTQAYAANLSNTLGRIVKDVPDFGKLEGFDRAFFEGQGFTPDDFALLKQAPADNGGMFATTMLTANSVAKIPNKAITNLLGNVDPAAYRQELTEKLLGAIHSEAAMGVLQPSVKSKAAMALGTTRGTLGGELVASMMQFKSFPLSVLWQNVQRMQAFDGAGQVGYAVAFLSAATIGGGIVVQIKELMAGKNPRDMTDPSFAVKAMTQGGGLGIYGDLLFNSPTTGDIMKMALGPTMTDIGDTMNVLTKPIRRVVDGKELDADMFARDTVRMIKSKIPGATLWYTRALIDHAFLNDVQESLSPGYLSRMENRAARQYNQSYWWSPHDGLPQRAPDISEAWQP